MRRTRGFFSRPAAQVALDLVGDVLVRILPDGTRLSVRIAETEAYGPDDPASHAYRGRTQRNSAMFGEPGHLYVYFTYGMHFCMNVVTDADGVGSAVLIRAAQPVEGLDEMSRRRSNPSERLLCSGPARLCQALGVDREQNGLDLAASEEMWIETGPGQEVTAGPRVGIRSATQTRWRFWTPGDPFVSRPSR